MDDSNGFLEGVNWQHCFLCLNTNILDDVDTVDSVPKIASYVKVEPEVVDTSVQLYSLQRLLRYLNMDMDKVLLRENGHEKILHIPSDLSSNVQRKTMLKAELCDRCAFLIDKFSRLYQQLERIQLEMELSLKGIHDELMTRENDDIDNLHKSYEGGHPTIVFNSSEGFIAQAKVEEVLTIRNEIMEKCAHKLKSATTPRVQIHRLARDQVNSKLCKSRSKLGGDFHQRPTSSFEKDDEEESNRSNNLTEATVEFEMDIGNVKVERNTHLDVDENDDNSEIANGVPKKATKIPECCINPKNGKYKCPARACQKQFLNKHGYTQHYRSVHLQIRHRCPDCGKEFHHKFHYNRHHFSAHGGLQFKCRVCGKGFTKRANLLMHIKLTHEGMDYRCKFCPASFATTDGRHRHNKSGCPNTNRVVAAMNNV